MCERISVRELKNLVNEIADSESKKYGINIKIWPLSFIDIVNPNFNKDGKYTLMRRYEEYKEYLHYSGYSSAKYSTVVFIDKLYSKKMYRNMKELAKLAILEVRYNLVQQYNILLKKDTEYLRMISDREDGYLFKYKGAITKDFFQVLRTCYHEARHCEQRTFNRYTYERFLYDIEDFYMKYNLNKDYKHNHDSYSFEIGANIYGTRMAKEYLMKNYPEIYKRDCYVIEAMEKKYQSDYILYNPSYTIDKVIPWIKIVSSFGNNDIIKRDFINDTSPVLSIFLNGDGSFKRPSEVMNDERYLTLDKRITYAIFSSLSFLKEVKYMDNLLDEEVDIINESMDYTSVICEMQKIYYDKVVEQNKAKRGYFEREMAKTVYLRLFSSRHKYIKKYLNSLERNSRLVDGKNRK